MSIYGPPLDEPPNPTSQEARAQLAAADAPPIISRRDRRLHACALAGAGLCFGIYAVLLEEFGGDEPRATVFLFVLTAGTAAAFALTGLARSTPRHANLQTWLGFVISLPLSSAGTLVLRFKGPADAPLWLQGLVIVVVALPLSLVGLRILWSGNR